jgi:hypothetical protein
MKVGSLREVTVENGLRLMFWIGVAGYMFFTFCVDWRMSNWKYTKLGIMTKIFEDGNE